MGIPVDCIKTVNRVRVADLQVEGLVQWLFSPHVLDGREAPSSNVNTCYTSDVAYHKRNSFICVLWVEENIRRVVCLQVGDTGVLRSGRSGRCWFCDEAEYWCLVVRWGNVGWLVLK